MLVAVIVTAAGFGTIHGAVYLPAAVIVPKTLFPFGIPSTVQLTARFPTPVTVAVQVEVWVTVKEFGEQEAEMELITFAGPELVTFRLTFCTCVFPPPTPCTCIVEAPMAAVLETERVMSDDDPGVIEDGVKEAVMPDGRFKAESATLPENPLIGEIRIVEVAVVLCFGLSEEGFAESAKSVCADG